jgi:hypothetical protein
MRAYRPLAPAGALGGEEYVEHSPCPARAREFGSRDAARSKSRSATHVHSSWRSSIFPGAALRVERSRYPCGHEREPLRENAAYARSGSQCPPQFAPPNKKRSAPPCGTVWTPYVKCSPLLGELRQFEGTVPAGRELSGAAPRRAVPERHSVREQRAGTRDRGDGSRRLRRSAGGTSVSSECARIPMAHPIAPASTRCAPATHRSCSSSEAGRRNHLAPAQIRSRMDARSQGCQTGQSLQY